MMARMIKIVHNITFIIAWYAHKESNFGQNLVRISFYH